MRAPRLTCQQLSSKLKTTRPVAAPFAAMMAVQRPFSAQRDNSMYHMFCYKCSIYTTGQPFECLLFLLLSSVARKSSCREFGD
ncbi:hypothetical protein HPB47_019779 [Ixodes persulcatus]|uniref:Uncharacterized protein n=1 Tax=Ixodes persulcatus TaxID=34615 RepID=A0AC60QH84_IXOPE|nr:hypothetical protein HPB47_019779 [Ixodes persulcatus]